MSLNEFAQDLDAKENGVWTEVSDMRFLIAHVNNSAWKDTYKRLENQAYGSSKRQKEKRNTEKDVKIMLECLAATCVLDWEGVALDDEELIFSKAKSIEIFTDKRFQVLAEMLLEFATDQERFMEDQVQDDEDLVKK